MQGRSHFTMFEPLVQELARRGHDVDVVSHFPQKTPIDGYNDLSVAGTLPILVNNMSMEMFHGKTQWDVMMFMLNEAGINVCEAVFKTKVLQDLKNTKKKYDVLITEVFATDCMLGFAHHFGIPSIGMTSSVSLPWGGDRFGNPDNPSYIPNYFVPYKSKMTLYERIVNTLTLIGAKLGYEFISTRASNALARNFFGPNLPHLKELTFNMSLLLVNSHFSLNQARPTVPNFVEVAGLHIRDPKPLPEKIKKLVETDSEGIIYLSMGSMLLTETFDDDKLQGLFDAFKELPYKVLWKATREKFSRNVTIPNNIHFEPWLPQFDLLCHPKVKLFVTHGGLMGTQEAVYCGVPTIGIPIFADQMNNVRNCETRGLAIEVPYEEIRKDRVLVAARKLLEDPRYKKNVERTSRLFRDRPHNALDTAVYWVEYVIRNNGAPELRSTVTELQWYQYLLLDVIAVLTTTLLIIFSLIYVVIKRILRVFSPKPKTKLKTK
ncbi:UDP-glucuronosyltransferase [Rhyzopertha dominica]|nr:UDP-glucuronosyltransferase [Rhyzopertha dominica]